MWGFVYWFSWLDNKEKQKQNPKNEDDKCFQYVANVVLNYEKIKWNPERIWNIKPFINKYNYPSERMTGKGLKKIIQ